MPGAAARGIPSHDSVLQIGVSHQYNDHVPILKFVEYNWKLKPLTDRSRDNLPNPKQHGANPYVPTNSPATGDLTDMFDFDKD